MTSYRRSSVPGGTFFFTVNLAERNLSFLTERLDLLRLAFRETRRRHPFLIDAIVVLPEHLHTVWTMPEGDADFATRWRLIKSVFLTCTTPSASPTPLQGGEQNEQRRLRRRRSLLLVWFLHHFGVRLFSVVAETFTCEKACMASDDARVSCSTAVRVVFRVLWIAFIVFSSAMGSS